MPEIGNFDASQVDPSQSYDPIPAGWYAFQILGTEVRDNGREGTGKHLWFEYETLENHHPDLKGRRVWGRLNLWHQGSPKSEQTVQIAQREFSAVCHAVGQLQVSNTDVLHGKQIALKLKIRPASGQYEAVNDVVGYDAVSARFQAGGAPAQQASAPSASQPTGSPPASSTPPWQK